MAALRKAVYTHQEKKKKWCLSVNFNSLNEKNYLWIGSFKDMLLLPSSVIFMQIQLENGWMTISWSERDQVCGSVCIANNYLCLFLLFPPPQCANQCSAVPALTNIRRAKDSQWVINISTHRKSKYSLWAYFKSLSFTLVYIRLLWCWGKKGYSANTKSSSRFLRLVWRKKIYS